MIVIKNLNELVKLTDTLKNNPDEHPDNPALIKKIDEFEFDIIISDVQENAQA